MKIDLHVHSASSKRPSQWILQKINCPESFSDPKTVYRIAKERGMDFVTITDHNTIEGALSIAHLPDTFISEEVTSYFPEDGCKIHVVAHRITEAQHRDILEVRNNVYELVEYFNQNKIFNIIAHPLYAVNDRLTLSHFEQMILLFKNFELNGSRNDLQNRTLENILSDLSEDDILKLSEKYNYGPLFDEPHMKNFTGGSDDHSGLNIARSHTIVEDVKTPEEYFKKLGEGLGKVSSVNATPNTMAHNLYGIAYQYYKNRFNFSKHVNKDNMLKFLDRSLQPESEAEGFISKFYNFLNHKKKKKNEIQNPTMIALLRKESDKFLEENPELLSRISDNTITSEEKEEIWFSFVNQVLNKTLKHTGDSLLGNLYGAHVFNIFQTIGSVGGLYTLIAPYFVSFSQFNKDKEINRTVIKKFRDEKLLGKQERVKLGHFTDTFFDVNGVAKTLQQQLNVAIKNNKNLTIITCDNRNRKDLKGVKNFNPVGVYEIPEYKSQKLYYPPFLEMLKFCFEKGFTHIHSATPGPIGLAALAIAHTLKLPFTGTYHTDFPGYAKYLTGDDFMGDLTWKYMVWYYDRMDTIYVSSKSSLEELKEKGIKEEKIKLIPRGINTNLFNPSRRNGVLQKNYSIKKEKTTLLYVGRVSKEKNLPVLKDSYLELSKVRDDIHLIVVGDGPYLSEMKENLKDTNTTFTGYVEGENLADIYASSDIFIFPSKSDTFGNVVLEAQSSGIPVIVSKSGGPCENMKNYETGLIVEDDDLESYIKAIEYLADNMDIREKMGIKARKYLEKRSFENAFMENWQMYRHVPGAFGEGFKRSSLF